MLNICISCKTILICLIGIFINQSIASYHCLIVIFYVFNHILEQTNIGSNDGRKWTMVGCDGLPYALGSRIQDSLFKCVECTREFVCREEFKEHRKEHSHCMLTPLVDCRKYNNIVLIPGKFIGKLLYIRLILLIADYAV